MRKRSNTDSTPEETQPIENLPRHVAIIMDGNNRWARRKKLPGGAGHKAGLDTVRAIMEACSEYGIETLTLFAFSSENWRRPETEVSALMSLFLNALKREVKKLAKNNIRLRVIGDRHRFSQAIQKHIAEAERLTADNDGCTVVIAADYGGRWDIAQAARILAAQVLSNEIQLDDITPESFQSAISIGELPEPDLCIRTGGERRISNFLLWQMAYTELYFTDTYWPDFNKAEFLKALKNYSKRERRFGTTSNKVGE
jgi:undecaprenyl diphosphate synthase